MNYAESFRIRIFLDRMWIQTFFSWSRISTVRKDLKKETITWRTRIGFPIDAPPLFFDARRLYKRPKYTRRQNLYIRPPPSPSPLTSTLILIFHFSRKSKHSSRSSGSTRPDDEERKSSRSSRRSKQSEQDDDVKKEPIEVKQEPTGD